MKIDVDKAINLGMKRKASQHWPLYGGGTLDRTAYVTASEIGYCERKIWLDKEALRNSDYKPEYGTVLPDDWGMMERGHVIEAWAVENLMRAIDVPLLFAGKDQVSFAHSSQSATPDGVFDLDDGGYQLEIKSIHPLTSPSNLPRAVHVDQIIQAADLVSHTLDLEPLGGVLIYIDASDYKKKHQFHIPFDAGKADELHERASRIMECNDPAELKPEGMFKDQCKYCAHTGRCASINATSRNGDNGNDELAKAIFG